MRLAAQESRAITETTGQFVKDQRATLYLFGSRTNDQSKGGDIDLALITDEPQLATEIKARKHHLLAQIKDRIGDQKIDLIIQSRETAAQDPFLKIALSTAVTLKEWD